MGNELKVFEQRDALGQCLQMYGDVNSPMFLAKDVALWLGNDVTQLKKFLNNVDESEKVRNSITTLGGVQETWFLTEDGLYEVLMLSRKPIAKEFKREVKNILKQIRQTGGYIPIQQEDTEEMIMAKAFQIMQKTLAKKDEIIELQKPKVEAYDILMDSKSNIDFAEFVKSAKLKIGRNLFMGILRDKSILRQNNEPYQNYITQEYFEVIQTVKNGYSHSKTLITKKGTDWLIKKCKEWEIIS